MGERINTIMKSVEFPTKENGIFETCVNQFEKEQSTNEEAVRIVFSSFDNSSIENILIKVIILNNRYSAGLTDNQISESKRIEYESKDKAIPVDVTTMAEHIFNNRNLFDSISKKEDIIELVEKLRKVDDKHQDAYSFATKYCSRTFKEYDIPIVDSYVKGLLYRLNKKKPFTYDFTQKDLNTYQEYCRIYNDFVKDFVEKTGLSKENYKNIDKYLWQYAKDLLVNDNIDIRI